MTKNSVRRSRCFEPNRTWGFHGGEFCVIARTQIHVAALLLMFDSSSIIEDGLYGCLWILFWYTVRNSRFGEVAWKVNVKFGGKGKWVGVSMSDVNKVNWSIWMLKRWAIDWKYWNQTKPWIVMGAHSKFTSIKDTLILTPSMPRFTPSLLEEVGHVLLVTSTALAMSLSGKYGTGVESVFWQNSLVK